METYAHPEFLVETDWVAVHLDDRSIRLVESDEDALLYDTGHIPGAVKVDWFTDLQDRVRRDFISPKDFETLCSKLGIAKETEVVFYGDKSNWFATYAFWLFRYYGHEKLRIMNGGRQKWELEGCPYTKVVRQYLPTAYQASQPNPEIRAMREEVFAQIDSHQPLVDVRSPQEYAGELIHMPGYPQEGAWRGGHVPGAQNIPWNKACNEPDSTFKTAAQLQKLYEEEGITPEKEIIAYCRIGERSSHTWFVLTYLLGYTHVKNYDGSWMEWGNLVNAPIEK